MALLTVIFIVFWFACTATPIFGQILVLTTMIRNKLLRDNDSSYLIVGVLAGDFLSCCATLWQLMLGFIDPPSGEPFFTKGQCLLMEAPTIAGVVISQIATVSLAVDRMNALRDQVAYYQKNHFKSAMIWWTTGGLLGLVTAAMPQIANDVGTVIHFTDPTWPKWFRWYWIEFSIIVSTVVLVAYLLVIVYSRKMNNPLKKNENRRADERRITRERLITKTTMRVLTVYVLFWGLPSIVYNVTAIFNVNLGALFGLLMMIGSVSCSLANVIFLLMREDIRRGVELLFGYQRQRMHSISRITGQNISINTIRIAISK